MTNNVSGEIIMYTELIIDDRENPSYAIRTKSCRRRNKILFHLLKQPFKDSDGNLVDMDRRSEHSRRSINHKSLQVN